MTIISLGEFNKNMIYILIAAISKLVVELILHLLPDKAKLDNHPFILGLNAGLGMSLAIIPHLYIYIYSNITEKDKSKIQEKLIDRSELNKNATALTTNKYIDQLFKNSNPIIKRNKYLTLFFCSLLDYIQKILIFLFSYNITINFWIFDIVFINLFTSLITKNQIYTHQYFSIVIMIIFGIILNVVNLYKIKSEDIPMLIISILIEIIYSLGIVLAKHGMDDLFCSPFEVTFYEGIFALILNIIFLLISTHIPISFEKVRYFSKIFKISEYKGKNYLDNFYEYYNEFGFVEVLIFIVAMFGRASFNLFSHITIKYFTSSHVVLILILGEMFLSFNGKNTTEVIITVIVFIVEIFMIIIFCEIIELNFCGFEINTRKNIKERAGTMIFDEDDTESNYAGDNGDMIELTDEY